MPYLPLNIDIRGKKVLVAGGGTVAERKIRVLLNAEAVVHVVSPDISSKIKSLENDKTLFLINRPYQTGDLAGVILAVAATSNPLTNQTIAADAHQLGILVNVTDAPESGNCSFPALLRRGKLEISVSTNGTCPGFAAEIRDRIAAEIGEEFGIMLETLALEREKLLTEGGLNTYNTQVLRSRIQELLDELIKHKERVP